MSNERDSGTSILAIVSTLVTAASIIVTLFTIPGFAYHPLRTTQTTSIVTTETPRGLAPPSSKSRRAKTVSRKTIDEKPVRQEPAPSRVEPAVAVPEPPPASVAQAAAMVASAPPSVESHEPTAADGRYRGTVVDCREESTVPGSAAKLCVDLGGKTVSAAMDSHLYVLVGGWNKRVPLYAGDVVRFEVRHGEIASAELLSDSHGR